MANCLGTTAEIKNTNIYSLYIEGTESLHILMVKISDVKNYSPEEMVITLLSISPEIRKTKHERWGLNID